MALLVPASRQIDRVGGWTKDTQFTSTMGQTITASGTPHSLGTITEIVAATAFEADWIEIGVQNSFTSTALTDQLLNIYIGAGGSEVLLIDSLQSGWASAAGNGLVPNRWWFPVRIPGGARISGALRALIASDTVEVMIRYGNSNGMHWCGSGVETLGEDTAASRGTAVTPDTAAPSWATMGTTGRRYRYIAAVAVGNHDATANTIGESVTIGSGSAMIQGLGGILQGMFSSEAVVIVDPGRWCDIASGTSLQMRVWSHAGPSGATYGTLYGVY